MPKEKLDILIFIVVGTVSLLSLSLLFVGIVYKYQKRMQHKQAEFYQTILSTQENERKRLAKEIHDGLGGLLGNARFQLSEIIELKKSEKENTGNLQHVFDLISKSIEEARSASNALMPEAIRRFGLKGAINDLVKMYTPYFQIELTNECPDSLNDSMQLNIYRLLHELFNNAQKHSSANKIELEIVADASKLYIHFGDNGKGFDYNAMMRSNTGSGIQNIKNRVELLNGKLDVHSNDGAVYDFIFTR